MFEFVDGRRTGDDADLGKGKGFEDVNIGGLIKVDVNKVVEGDEVNEVNEDINKVVEGDEVNEVNEDIIKVVKEVKSKQ